MLVVCSIDDVQQYGRGTVYRTTIGDTRGMGQYPALECLYPTWELVMGYKRRKLSAAQYIAGYKRLLESRAAAVKAWVASLDPEQDVTLLCYCQEGVFCHRRLLASMVGQLRPDIEVVVH